jgi:hypothetical protein
MPTTVDILEAAQAEYYEAVGAGSLDDVLRAKCFEVVKLRAALKDAMQYMESESGDRGQLAGSAVRHAKWQAWKELVGK